MSLHDKCNKVTQTLVSLRRCLKSLTQEHYIDLKDAEKMLDKFEDEFKSAKDRCTTRMTYQPASASVQ